MRKLLWLLLVVWLFVAMLCVNVQAADMLWDHVDVGITDGYVVYFNETGQMDAPYNKTMLKTALTVAGQTITMPNFEPALNLQIGQQYNLWVVAYNVAGVSGPSNIVQHTITAYTPPVDSLPSGTVIQIPNAAVTIRVP